jgi:hypothetical protein
MSRYAYGAKCTIEGCRSIDVLQWNRLGYLSGRSAFSWQWTLDGENVATIGVVSSRDGVTLKYKSRSYGEDWSDVEHHVPISWTPCRFGGERPWFACSVYKSGKYCGRDVVKLYQRGKLFACRHCHGLAYASQQESSNQRGLYRAQKIRTRLGGSVSMFEDFPDKPKGMHCRTYDRLRGRYDMAEARSMAGLEHFLSRLDPTGS